MYKAGGSFHHVLESSQKDGIFYLRVLMEEWYVLCKSFNFTISHVLVNKNNRLFIISTCNVPEKKEYNSILANSLAIVHWAIH